MSRDGKQTVVVLGLGGIGHPAAVALAGGPWTLHLVDDDLVESSNLHRLVHARDEDLGRPKIEVVRDALVNAGHAADAVQLTFGRALPHSILELVSGASVVIEGADNYPTKFLTADACALAHVPCVHGAAVAWRGTVFTVRPGVSACYRCVFEDLPSGDQMNCATAGVFGPLTTLVGTLMAREAARVLHHDFSMAGTMLSVNAYDGTARNVGFRRRATCALCGTASIRSLDLERYTQSCAG